MNKSLLVATTVEEVASVVGIPFLIICVQIIYRQTQKQKTIIKTTQKERKKEIDAYIFTTWRIRHLKQSARHFGKWTYSHSVVWCVKTEDRSRNAEIESCSRRTQERFIGGRKCFPTLPEFQSAHMTCTCEYMLRGCIHLNVYSHALAQHQPIPRQTQLHLGQLSGWKDLNFTLKH